LRRDIDWTFVIRAIFIESLEFPLKLPLSFPGCFQLRPLRGESSFLLLRFPLGCLLSTLLLLLFDLALTNLILERTKTSCLGLSFPVHFVFLLMSFLPKDQLECVFESSNMRDRIITKAWGNSKLTLDASWQLLAPLAHL
jgi:hypothetical protein